MAETRLVGQNYETPDLRAKVTGRAKYSEDFRAPGMLFTRLLNAISDALCDEVFRRAPVNPDGILASLDAGRFVGLPLTAHV